MLRRRLKRLGYGVCGAWLGLASSGLAEPDRAPRSGRFDVVTYNVAGLPEGLSTVHPVANLPVIGGLLNRFDLAFVQEDYAYPELLRQRLRLPYRSAPFVRGQALHFGDGLSLFSRFPLGEVTRSRWASCHGVLDSYSDCLTPKGIASSRLEISPGVLIDIYNVHLDAGGGAGDVQARRAQLQQLVSTIENLSKDRTLLLGGDFNLTRQELPEFRKLTGKVGLIDACDQLRCRQSWRLDRVLFRNGVGPRLLPRAWRLGASFHDSQGRALSDHAPVTVRFSWTAT